MTTKDTQIAIGILSAALIAADIFLYAWYGVEATISRAMYAISREWQLVTVIWGGLAAHFFMVHDGHWCGWYRELKPVVLLVLGFIIFRLAWTQHV